MSISNKCLPAAVAGAFVGVMCLGTASATTTYADVPTLEIRYNTADLATDGGVHVLYRRIVSAAEQACPPPSSGSWAVSSAIRDCRRLMIDLAVRKINSPVLAAVRAGDAKEG